MPLLLQSVPGRSGALPVGQPLRSRPVETANDQYGAEAVRRIIAVLMLFVLAGRPNFRPIVRYIHEIREISRHRKELRILYPTANPLVPDPRTNLRVDAELAQVRPE